MKKFITTITLQHQGAEKHAYIQEGVTTPRIMTAFPILQKVRDVVSAGEQIALVPLVVGSPQESRNYREFEQELQALAAERGFTYTLNPICKENNEKVESMIRLFSDIICQVSDGDQLYACVTYGTKPMATLTTMALHYAYRVKKQVSVEAIVYGLKNWGAENEPVCSLYDTTALFYIDCLIDRIADMQVADPETALRSLLGTE